MDNRKILEAIDEYISRLQEARALLSNERGRPTIRRRSPSGRRKRVLSPEARKRIADAQRARWAKWKKAKSQKARS